MRLKLLCFIIRTTFPVVFHVSNNSFYFFTLMFQNMTRACFLPGFAKLQNTSSSIVIIIFGAKSIGGCVRGRSRVPVTPKPASSDHLQSYSSIVRKFKNIFFFGNRKRLNCDENKNLKTSSKLFPPL